MFEADRIGAIMADEEKRRGMAPLHAKNDLSVRVVGNSPKVQGVMGRDCAFSQSAGVANVDDRWPSPTGTIRADGSRKPRSRRSGSPSMIFLSASPLMSLARKHTRVACGYPRAFG